jgi:uncharacterized protein (TIGR02300 family)
VAKPEWGKKRLCPSCGTKFYDLRKNPPACPSCGETVDVEAPTKSKRSRGKDSGRGKAAPAAAAAAPAEEEPVLGEEAEAAPLGEESSYEDTGEEIDDGSDLGEEEAFTNVVDDDQEDN